MIDRVVADSAGGSSRCPSASKWFVDGLVDGSIGFGGEESAGASFLRRDGTVWTTDKDGIIADLLACELTARTGQDPGVAYGQLTERFGSPVYKRVDTPATPGEAALGGLSASDVTAKELAGEPISEILTEAPGNGAPIGGLKVTTESGWFAARPSGTENVAKVYAESFKGGDHLERLLAEAQALVGEVTSGAWNGRPASGPPVPALSAVDWLRSGGNGSARGRNRSRRRHSPHVGRQSLPSPTCASGGSGTTTA